MVMRKLIFTFTRFTLEPDTCFPVACNKKVTFLGQTYIVGGIQTLQKSHVLLDLDCEMNSNLQV